LVPIMWVGHSIFLCGLLFGRTIGWIGQVRDDHRVPLALAVHNFWPHTIVGVVSLTIVAMTYPAGLFYAAFIALGPALSIPLAVITSSPAVGAALLRLGIGRLPEETTPPAMLKTLAIPALAMSAPKPRAA